MASYGYLIINDGLMADASAGPGIATSFSVGLGCSQDAVSLGGGFRSKAYFSKNLNRIAPAKNPVGSAKKVVSQYAGCDEASIVRKRVLAMSRIKLSVSQEEFRFRLPSVYEVRMSSGGTTSAIKIEASDSVQAERHVQNKFPGFTVLSVEMVR